MVGTQLPKVCWVSFLDAQLLTVGDLFYLNIVINRSEPMPSRPITQIVRIVKLNGEESVEILM